MAGAAGQVAVLGLTPQVTIDATERTDQLVIAALDGDDVVEGSGRRRALGGPGLDVLDGGPGDNVVIQG